MQESVKRVLYLGPFVLLLAIVLAFSPISAHASYASSTWTGETIGWSNVRAGPSTSYSIAAVYAPNTRVTVYATVSGQAVWGGISSWYRISSFSSSPLYIYGGLVVTFCMTRGGVRCMDLAPTSGTMIRNMAGKPAPMAALPCP